uniref:Uncharacterized protein n=1 Tax=Rhizophora mucronata TaxID=61149 RepID=A0A2P2QXZ4_RHIMU
MSQFIIFTFDSLAFVIHKDLCVISFAFIFLLLPLL